MRTLYPPIAPYVTHSLAVDGGHTLHVEECGRLDGRPTLYLHGGPGGSGIQPLHRRFFDPDAHRLVLFDQRGCGRSTPHAGLTDNTTKHLLHDIETVRRHLGIERWIVAGGSWGTTLALLYAQRWPERVTGLVLRSVFLCRGRDFAWLYGGGAAHLHPDHWEDFLRPLPEAERDRPMAAYHRLLTGSDEVARMGAAKAWARWEARLGTLRPNAEEDPDTQSPTAAYSLARLACHYFIHDAFLEDDQILRNARRLADIPGVLVHGRYDAACPLEQAWALHRAWPEADLRIVPLAGHSPAEPDLARAYTDAVHLLRDRA